MAYKSVRLLVEAIHKQVDEQRKLLMAADPANSDRTLSDASLANGAAQENLIELRKMFDELAAKADRPTIEDVVRLSPGEYVATMKPLVRMYHRQLMAIDKLASALNEDLLASATILVIMGVADDGKTKTFVRTAHDPTKPEIDLAVQVMLTAIDAGTKQFLEEGAAVAEKVLKLEEDPPGTDEPLRVRYADLIQPEDAERNARAVLVIDMNDIVITDLQNGNVGRKATQEEIDSCITVKDPGRDDCDDLAIPGNMTGAPELEIDERTRLLKMAERVGWDSTEGMELRDRAKNYAPGERLT